MQPPRHISFALLLAVGLIVPCARGADEKKSIYNQPADPAAAVRAEPTPKNEPTDEEKKEGFVSIFNGHDLDNWVYGKPRKGEGVNKAGKGYQVENGIIYSTKTDGGNMFTKQEYADFILRFEFKLTPSANNGIGIRAPMTGDVAYTGMEIQILDENGPAYHKPNREIRPAQYHGSIYDVFPAKAGHLKPVGEWNEEEIMAQGRHVKVTLNGTIIVDANLDDAKDPEVLKKHPGLQNKSGHIGFLGHGAMVEFRNLRVKDLTK